METKQVYSNSKNAQQTICERELASIPTSYGKLVFLASLRNAHTSRYEDFSLPSSMNKTDVHDALRRIHEIVFREWIGLTLERKMADIELYIGSIHQVERTELIDTWLRLTPYKNLVPASIQGPDRVRHTSDFEAILGLLKNVYGVSGPNQAA